MVFENIKVRNLTPRNLFRHGMVGFHGYNKGEKRNLDIIKDIIYHKSRAVKYQSIFKLFKNNLPEKWFLRSSLNKGDFQIDGADYFFSGKVYKHGLENFVYLLDSKDPKAPKFIIKFDIDTVIYKNKDYRDLENGSLDKRAAFDLIVNTFSDIPLVEIPGKIYFICRNPINNKYSLASLMEFVSFDEEESFDLFNAENKGQVERLMVRFPELRKSIKEIINRYFSLKDSGIIIDLFGDSNVLLGLKNGQPRISFVDADTYLDEIEEEKIKARTSFLLELLKSKTT